LYQVSVPTVNEHLATIYAERELDQEATIRNFRIVQREGTRDVTRNIDHYNLDAILAVGYRVRSARGTAFRQWATAQLRELLVKGFVLDDERLKEGRSIGGDYFDELLERIRDIRASERLFYQKITDIYATSIDYDPTHSTSQTFFATVQNKLHLAIHGHTAAEIIRQRADASRPQMGLTTWWRRCSDWSRIRRRSRRGNGRRRGAQSNRLVAGVQLDAQSMADGFTDGDPPNTPASHPQPDGAWTVRFSHRHRRRTTAKPFDRKARGHPGAPGHPGELTAPPHRYVEGVISPGRRNPVPARRDRASGCDRATMPVRANAPLVLCNPGLFCSRPQ
jgi:hypothetical protein